MYLKPESDWLDDYLVETEEIEYSHEAIRRKAEEWMQNTRNENAYVKAVYEYVRDNISHSWDIQSTLVTCKASEVLLYREGICYAKSNLLCALLRVRGIPAGFCYQKLTLGDTPNTGYVIHALNGIYLRSVGRWVRLDAWGIKQEWMPNFCSMTRGWYSPFEPIVERSTIRSYSPVLMSRRSPRSSSIRTACTCVSTACRPTWSERISFIIQRRQAERLGACLTFLARCMGSLYGYISSRLSINLDMQCDVAQIVAIDLIADARLVGDLDLAVANGHFRRDDVPVPVAC